MIRLSSSGIVGNVSKTASVTVFKSNVTVFTPVRTPRVLDNPVTLLETNEEDSVVVSGVVTVREDTTGVETPVGSINGDGDGLDSERGSKVSSGSINLLVTRDVVDGRSSGQSLLARTIDSLVGIVSFSSDLVLLNVQESSILVTTTTTVIVVLSSATVDELLFRKVNRSVSLTSDDQSRFNGTGGRESPARTTTSLILNISNLVSINPVDINAGISINVSSDGFSREFTLFSKISADEFFLGQIEELGDTISTSFVLLDDFEVGGEDFHSVLFKIGIRELHVVGSLPLSPELSDGFILNSGLVVALDCKENSRTEEGGTQKGQ